MHVLEPFLPDLDLTPDHNASDLEQAYKANSLVQKYLKQFLRGETDLGTFEDVIESVGICPIEYWDVVEDNVDAICNDQQRIEQIDSLDSILLLPGRDF